MKYYPFYLFVLILTLFVSCKQEDTKDIIPELSENLFIDLDQELISEKWSCLQDISDRGYKVEEFIIHNLKNMKKLFLAIIKRN